MNEKEGEAPFEDPCVRRNCLARGKHVAQFDEQRAVDANRWAVQKAAHNDA
jgi:hypothetical protein